MSAPARLVVAGAAMVHGAGPAAASLLDHLAGGGSSDGWARAALSSPNVLPFRQRRLAGAQARAYPKVPPLRDTLDFWRKKKILPSRVFDLLSDEEKFAAGRLAGVWQTSFTRAIYDSLRDAIKDGETLQEWAPKAQAILDGWGGARKPRLYSGDEWSPWYADLVFRNAQIAANAAGRYAEMFSDEWIELAPYFQHSAINDKRVRPNHWAFNGMVFPKNEAWARQYLSPLGHNCRCISVELTIAQVKDEGWRVVKRGQLTLEPDDGFGGDKAAMIPQALRRAA